MDLTNIIERYTWGFFKENILKNDFENYLQQFKRIKKNLSFVYACENNTEIPNLYFQADRVFKDFKQIMNENIYLLVIVSSKSRYDGEEKWIHPLKKLYNKYNGKLLILDIKDEFMNYVVKDFEMTQNELILINLLKENNGNLDTKLTDIDKLLTGMNKRLTGMDKTLTEMNKTLKAILKFCTDSLMPELKEIKGELKNSRYQAQGRSQN